MYYEILQVPATATAEAIKKQYRKLSLHVHPDKPGGSADAFRRLTDAYETLSDEAARRNYDLSMRSPDVAHAPAVHSAVPIEITLDQAFAGCAVPFQVGGETWYADIPAGVDSNEVIVVPRPEGNVKVKVTVVNTTFLVRHGLDLLYTHPISLKEALCGVAFEIQYFQGQTLRLSTKGTVLSPTYKKILPQKGMRRDKNCGSLTIAFKIEFPALTAAQIAALENIL